mgnify:FL=1
MNSDHQARIVEQFTRQAIPFTMVPGHLDAIGHLQKISGVAADDTVLDVACGPGLVACAFARHCTNVTGIDLTPAMIEQAQQRQADEGLANLNWQVGDAVPLPWSDNSFSLVITRYSFHHLLAPASALAEMIRVCNPGGRVLVADVAMPLEKSAAYDRLEIMRDPSHIHALTTNEFSDLFLNSGLTECRTSSYGVEIELETQLRASFPAPGDEPRIREMVTADVGVDNLGINAQCQEGKIVYTVPIGVYVGRKME